MAVGKQFFLGMGLRLMYSSLLVKGATKNGKVYDASQWLDEQEFNVMNRLGDVLLQ